MDSGDAENGSEQRSEDSYNDSSTSEHSPVEDSDGLGDSDYEGEV